MVAILAVLTITVCLLVDWCVQVVQAKRARDRALSYGEWELPASATNPFSPPHGLFFHPSHSWAHVEPNGDVRIGLDGLIGFLLGDIDHVDLPAPGQEVTEGKEIAVLKQGDRELSITAPVNGRIVGVNRELIPDGHFIRSEPYGAGWVCEIKPKSLSEDLHNLMVDEQVTEWHSLEARRIIKFLSHSQGNGSNSDELPTEGLLLRGFMEGATDEEWQQFQAQFMS